MRQRTAGLRTSTLVAVGAAIFVSLGDRLFEIHGGSPGAVQIVAYVVSGIGFLGTGAIMKEGANVSGLNTAATLRGSGAVGACSRHPFGQIDTEIEATCTPHLSTATNSMQ